MVRGAKERQRGSVLITTVMSLAIIAALGYLLNAQTGMMFSVSRSGDDAQRARYLAEAGLRHHLTQVRLDKGNYSPTVGRTLVNHGTYRSHVLPLNGSPVTITSTGTTPNGATATLVRTYSVTCTSTTKTTLVSTYDPKGIPIAISEASPTSNTTNFLTVDNNSVQTNRTRSLLKFAPSAFPGAGVVILSATLKLDLQQHDPAMEGGTLYANRLVKAFWTDRVSWEGATSARDKWAMPGGDFTLVNEGTTNITAMTTVYNFDITKIVDGWINGGLANDGLILRTDVPSSESNHKLRFKSSTPLIEIKHC